MYIFFKSLCAIDINGSPRLCAAQLTENSIQLTAPPIISDKFIHCIITADSFYQAFLFSGSLDSEPFRKSCVWDQLGSGCCVFIS